MPSELVDFLLRFTAHVVIAACSGKICAVFLAAYFGFEFPLYLRRFIAGIGFSLVFYGAFVVGLERGKLVIVVDRLADSQQNREFIVQAVVIF